MRFPVVTAYYLIKLDVPLSEMRMRLAVLGDFLWYSDELREVLLRPREVHLVEQPAVLLDEDGVTAVTVAPAQPADELLEAQAAKILAPRVEVKTPTISAPLWGVYATMDGEVWGKGASFHAALHVACVAAQRLKQRVPGRTPRPLETAALTPDAVLEAIEGVLGSASRDVVEDYLKAHG